jgi:hypothetical protein
MDVRDLTKSVLSLSWALSLFGLKQAAGLLDASRSLVVNPEVPSSLDGAARSFVEQFGESLRQTFLVGDRFQREILPQIGALPPVLGSTIGMDPGPPSPASAPIDVAAGSEEEVIVRYGIGEGRFLDDPQFITLHIAMFQPSGQREGSYIGIQQAQGPFGPHLLLARPPMPSEPIDQPGGIPAPPICGHYKATWQFNDHDSITAVGPSLGHLVRLRDGSLLFCTGATGIVTGGTGRYQGASGVKSAVGVGRIPPGVRLQAGTTFQAKTVDTFRVVRSEHSTPPVTTVAPGAPGVASGPSPGPAIPLAFLPQVPKGADPETYQLDRVSRLLQKAAYFSIFSMPDPAQPDIPIPSPSNPNALIGVEVHEQLHRFELEVDPPTPDGCIRARKRIGQAVARVQIRWMVIPDEFQAGPGLVPPPTELDPGRSQRFAMLDGQMTWRDRAGSGFKAFGTGRTFPVMVGGKPQLRLGAVIDILEGFGRFRGLPGTISVNGYITPPQGLALNFILRFADPEGRLRATSTIAPLRPVADPDPDTVFLMVLGEVDPDHPTTIEQTSAGLRASVHERLRLVRIGFDLGGAQGVRSRTSEGPLVGTLSGTLLFNPFDPNPVTPIQTLDGLFTFFDRRGRTVATLKANIVEGRGFRTTLPGAPGPIYRFGGFGPFLGGTGVFQDAVGMISLNAAISVFPRTLSNSYVLRVSDPDGRFRASCARTWA